MCVCMLDARAYLAGNVVRSSLEALIVLMCRSVNEAEEIGRPLGTGPTPVSTLFNIVMREELAFGKRSHTSMYDSVFQFSVFQMCIVINLCLAS